MMTKRDDEIRVAMREHSDNRDSRMSFGCGARWADANPNAVDMSYLQNWYQDSIDETKEPIWTDKHLEELFNDFYLIPKKISVMKANEAPEKIYLQKYDMNTLVFLNKWNVSEEWSNKPCNEKIATNIEYIRTDAFVEKACEFLKSYRQDTSDGIGYIAGVINDKTIEDFKKYMEE